MTIGIYKLAFTGTDKCYIGQSINIEARYKQHIRSLRKGTATEKLLKAYQLFGEPNLDILTDCTVKDLNDLELETIEIYDSYNNGFNSTNLMHPIAKGEDHGNSKYSNEKVIEAAILLTDARNTAEKISEKTGISISVVRSIACLQNHSWLQELVPDVVLKLKELLGTRTYSGSSRKEYPAVRSPSGIVYENIPHFANFCAEHGIDRSHFTNLLKGKLKSHKGWTLATSSTILDQNFDPRCGKNKGIQYPDVLSPQGVLYKDIANAAEFCRQHDLDKSAFYHLLKGRVKAHKGWRLAHNG